MSIIRDIEKAAYGKNSYFRLLEYGLYREPQNEGDYSGTVPEDRLGTLRFVPEKEPKFVFDSTQILRRYAGDAADKWEKKGTIIVRGAMDWLFQDPEVLELMKQEVNV